MIAEVRFEKTTYLPSPQRFEAGTPNVAGAIGLGEAIRYFQRLDLDEVRQHERALLRQAEGALASIRGLRFIGVSPSRTNILSFVLEGAHPSDVGHLLDQQNVAVRAGHHCCQPLMRRFGLPGTVRASFSVYNSPEDVSALVAAVEKARGFL
jgi:cysteine desulfurase/selenocysteine lyase